MFNRLPQITLPMLGKNKSSRYWQILLLSLLIACMPPRNDSANSAYADKIKFDLEQFDEDGLYGPPDGKQALSYEFCIPAKEEYADEVQSIDPTLTVHPTLPGRIGCTDNEYLCLGNTHQKNYREVLFNLARLDYIEKIEQSFFED